MKRLSTRNVIVSGTQGAWLNVVSGLLNDRGWDIAWPGQDLEIRDGQLFFEHNRQNIEVQNIHQSLCDRHGMSGLLDTHLPRFYDIPYPGPQEFVSMFDKQVVITGTCLNAFLDIWVNVADVVIDIQATEEEDINALRQWTKNAFATDHLNDIRRVHLERYQEHLKLFPQTFTMTNAEVRDKRFDGLTQFLNSVF